MRLRRVAGILVCVLMTPTIAWIVWDRVEASRLSRRLDALFPFVEAEGGSPPRDKRAAASTEAGNEALRLYVEAGRLATPPPLEASKLPLQETIKAIEALSGLPRSEAARDVRLDGLRRIEASYARTLDLLERASALDAAAPEELESSRELWTLRRIADVNTVRIARLAFAGDGNAAAAALISTQRLRRFSPAWMAARDPFRTTHSLGLTLGFGSPSEPALQQLQREYEKAQPDHVLEDMIVNSRYQIARAVAPEEFGMTGRRMDLLQGVLYRLGRGLRNNRLLAELDRYDEALAVAEQPWPSKLDAAKALAQKYDLPRAAGRRSLLENLFAPFRGAAIFELTTVVPIAGEALARARVSIVALTIERYRRAHGGSLPATLTDVVPAYVAAIPVDPFSGTALKYRRETNGYKVYSVGTNRQDDGGEWYVASDLNPYRRGDPKDLGIEVRIQ
jgi:hypothetical protein